MHEAQSKEATTELKIETAKAPRKRSAPRAKKYFAIVKHRQIDAITGVPAGTEFLEFADKPAMRETLGQPKYEGVDLRIIRGHEMNVKVRHSIGVN